MKLPLDNLPTVVDYMNAHGQAIVGSFNDYQSGDIHKTSQRMPDGSYMDVKYLVIKKVSIEEYRMMPYYRGRSNSAHYYLVTMD